MIPTNENSPVPLVGGAANEKPELPSRNPYKSAVPGDCTFAKTAAKAFW